MIMTSTAKISQAICAHGQVNRQTVNAVGPRNFEGLLEEVGPKLSRG